MLRKTSSKRLSVTSKKSRRDLFETKRKGEPEKHSCESPAKYLAILCDSSDEEVIPKIQRVVNFKEGRQVDVQNPSIQVQITSYESDTDVESSPLARKQLEELCDLKEEISEFSTPVKGRKNETQSPLKTPVLKPFRGRGDIEIVETECEIQSELESSKSAFAVSVKNTSSTSYGHDPQIYEFVSPEKVVQSPLASQSLVVQSDDSEDEQHIRKIQNSGVKSRETKAIKKQKFLPALAYKVEDAPMLGVVVIRCAIVEASDDKNLEKLVWCLCYDVSNERYRYLLLSQKSSRKIQCGICLRLYPPWCVSKRQHQTPDEVIHSVGFYQVVVPALLNISGESHRNILSSYTLPYAKYIKSMPGRTVDEIFKHFPEMKYQDNTISIQRSKFSPTVVLDAAVMWIFICRECQLLLIKDFASSLALIEMSLQYNHNIAPTNKFFRFFNLRIVRFVTEEVHSPFFSVLKCMGSQQATYLKLLWNSDTYTTPLEDLVPTPAAEVPMISINGLQQMLSQDCRVSVRGVIMSFTNSEMILEEAENQIEVSILRSFNRNFFIGADCVGTYVEIKLLRVTSECAFVLDQYSTMTVIPHSQLPFQS